MNKTNKITKKSLWLMTALCLLMVACDEKEETDGTEKIVTVSPETIAIPDGGGESTFTVTSTANWKISLAGSDWLAAFPMKGGAGETVVTLTADALVVGEDREVRVRILYEDNTEAATVPVSQGIVYPEEIIYLLSTDTVALPDQGNMRLMRLVSNGWWTLTPSDEWIHLDKATGSPGTYYIKVSADGNTATADRTGSIDLIIGEKQTSIVVTQGKAGDYYNDGDVVEFKKHAEGKGTGFPVVIVGDGFDRQDLKKGGWWEFFAREIAEAFHQVDMIYDLWDYFDVYILMSESEERGVNYPDNGLTGSKKVTYTRTRTKYGAHGASENMDKAISAAKAAVTRQGNPNASETCVIFMANGAYAGNASDPLARMGIDEQSYAYWAVHEFAGHIVSNMPDLYCQDRWPATDQFKLEMDERHKQGWDWFVDYRNDPGEVIWKTFIGREGYKRNLPEKNSKSDSIGVFPTCWSGFGNGDLWRPNEMDAMDNWYLCHGVGTRYQMWNIVMDVVGETAKVNNLNAFIAADTQRHRADCAYKASPYKWSDYNVSGKKTQSGHYDRFWEALWPRK
ncbi:MAG: BACON domain-containing protein [Prevotellaceae bacterium]|nr:BACON domain-containing protein [Prevotellaceae bacterium]